MRGTIRGFESSVITYQMALHPRDGEPYDGVAHGLPKTIWYLLVDS